MVKDLSELTNFQLLKELTLAREKVNILWEKCCNYDDIPKEEIFIIFSNDNPFLEEHGKAQSEVNRLINEGIERGCLR